MNKSKENLSDKAESNQLSKSREIGIRLMWVVLWPVFIGISGAALLIMLSGLVSSQQPAVGLYAGLFFGGVVVLCWSLIVILRRKKRLSLRIAASVLEVYVFVGVLMMIGLGALAVAAVSQNFSPESENQQAAASLLPPALTRTEQIDNQLRRIGATDNEINRFSTRYVENFDKTVTDEQRGSYQSYTNTLNGEFLYGELDIKTGTSPEDEQTIVAHEYLHHIWFAVLDQRTKNNLSSHLIGMYGRDGYMRQRVSGYDKAGTLSASELFSYYCTESSDRYLTTYVRESCSKYINRRVLTLY